MSTLGMRAIPLTDHPNTLPIQPEPTGLLIIRRPDVNETIIARNWNEGDPARCRLCSRHLCSVNSRNTCLIVAPELLDGESARLYRFPG